VIVGLTSCPGARSSLFGNLVAGSVSDPYFEDVWNDEPLRDASDLGPMAGVSERREESRS
jgi:hypothetical protein